MLRSKFASATHMFGVGTPELFWSSTRTSRSAAANTKTMQGQRLPFSAAYIAARRLLIDGFMPYWRAAFPRGWPGHQYEFRTCPRQRWGRKDVPIAASQLSGGRLPNLQHDDACEEYASASPHLSQVPALSAPNQKQLTSLKPQPR